MLFDLKNIDLKHVPKDILVGIIIALVSVPISMGYATVAGLPAIYGLYGSVFPVIVFGLLSSTKYFVFGVDATPVALVGAMLASMEIAAGSDEALAIVPAITVLVSLWLFLLYVFKAGKLINYISTPVMGGFITGIGLTIMMMQLPKACGGVGTSGEIVELVIDFVKQIPDFNLLSIILGLGTFAVLLVFRKITPKFPASVLVLVLGVIIQKIFDVGSKGVKLLPAVPGGMPKLHIPDILELIGDNTVNLVVLSFSIAMVILAQSLLTANSLSMKDGDIIDGNREILSYAMGNLTGAFFLTPPLNGSVSRTGMARGFGAKSQIMSISAGITMILLLLFGTGILEYMPVPVLTGIVMAALYGILEIDIAKRLFKSDKREFAIFMAACLGVLVFGTVYGVVIGIILSFVEVTLEAVVPPKYFQGIIVGHEGLFSLNRNKEAKPIKDTVIYRFGGNLFFANIDAFAEDLNGAIKDTTKVVLIDARGIGHIDSTAVDRLLLMYDNYKARGIKFYIVEHSGDLNDQLRRLGAARLIEQGVCRRTYSLALRAAGITKPYPVEGMDERISVPYTEADERLAEFEWAFGENADRKLNEFADEIANRILNDTDYSVEHLVEEEQKMSWGRIGLFDEDSFLTYLEKRLEAHKKTRSENVALVEKALKARREIIEKKLAELSPHGRELLEEHRKEIEDKEMQVNNGK